MNRRTGFFDSVPVMPVNRSNFDLSHEVKMSGKFGYIYPIACIDCLPNDNINWQSTLFARFAPMLAPIMHRVDAKIQRFFVPTRLICNPWEEFITGGQDGDATVVLPYYTPAGLAASVGDQYMRKGSLWDYFGLPVAEGADPAVWSAEQISALPFRAYSKIWNDWFRDPNFDDERDLDLDLQGNASASGSVFQLMRLASVAWEKDYFTSNLEKAQRGAEVLMPIAGTGSVDYRDQSIVRFSAGALPVTDSDTKLGTTNPDTGVDGGLVVKPDGGVGGPIEVYVDNISGINIEASSVTINDFRLALAVQRWLEIQERGGARYSDTIQSHFNKRPQDYRLQRSEYLGGGKMPVRISEVLAQANTDVGGNEIPVGDLAGHGVAVGKSYPCSYTCPEHGFFIVVLHIKPRTAYSQGIARMWSRKSRFDFGWPSLAHLGEQATINKEVFFSFNADDDDENAGVFGYLPRYAEYKFHNDRIAGDFRDTLAFWHLGRKFLVRPVLDADFTTLKEGDDEEETLRRIFAVQDGTDYIWLQIFHRVSANRPLPYFGIPQIVG